MLCCAGCLLQAKECPVQMVQLLDILEVIVPYKHFHKLRQFVNVKLPPGFPVKLSELEDWVCLQGCVCRGVSMVCVSAGVCL